MIWYRINKINEVNKIGFFGSLILVYMIGFEINLLRIDIILNINVEKFGSCGW